MQHPMKRRLAAALAFMALTGVVGTSHAFEKKDEGDNYHRIERGYEA